MKRLPILLPLLLLLAACGTQHQPPTPGPTPTVTALPRFHAGPAGGADGGQPITPVVGAPLPTTPPTPTQPLAGASGWYVSSFRAYDSGMEISAIVNAAGDHYHIWPVYVLAVIFAESGGYQYAWHDWGWPDVSGGFMQQTVQTLGGYGICNDDIACARVWESSATNSIWMGARILRSDMDATGYGYPFLWNAYNTGAGCHCTSPYYAAFLTNYYKALTYASNEPPPVKPTPPVAPKFPGKKWHAFTKKVSPYYHHHLRVEARLWRKGHVRTAHGAVSRPQWFPSHRTQRVGFMTMRFQDERLYWWPGRPHFKPKWIRVHHIG